MKKRKLLLSIVMATAVLSFSGCAVTNSLQSVNTDVEEDDDDEEAEDTDEAEADADTDGDGTDEGSSTRSASEGIQPDDDVIPGERSHGIT